MPLAVSRRTVIIGGAVVAALAVAVALMVVLARGPDSGEAARVPLAQPATEKDTVPRPRTYEKTDLPRSCGVRAATVKKYAPGDHTEQGRTSCRWYSEDCPGSCPASRSGERVLEVALSPEQPSSTDTGSAAGLALRKILPASVPAVTSGREPRAVRRLGDEAYYGYSSAVASPKSAMGGRLSLRAGNAVVTITYSGDTKAAHGRRLQVPEPEARKAVLAVGADVARALGAAASPRFGDPVRADQRPIRKVPRPCDLVPSSLADQLAPGARCQRAPNGLAVPAAQTGQVQGAYGAAYDACEWASTPAGAGPRRNLDVSVQTISDWRPGVGTWLAKREFRTAYYDGREGAGRFGFQRVRGLGDEAYAVQDSGPGNLGGTAGADVAFRYRNVIVLVTYTGSGKGPPLSGGQAIAAAYTVAARARAALPA